MKQCTCFALKAINCICAEREDENSFAHWFYGAPHRIKYLRDHPVFLAAQEAWDAAKKQEAEKQEHGEPVAWQWLTTAHFRKKLPKDAEKGAWNPLYTTPQQRTWVGLDPEEIRKTNHHMVDGAYHYSFKQGAEWAEAKLKEKNGA